MATEQATPAASETGTGGIARGERLVSLDAFRGFTMFWIVGGHALVTAFQALGHNPVIDTIVYHLSHTPWQGLRYYDLIWPCFMLMVGASIPFALAKRSATATGRKMTIRAVRRAVVLFLLGSLRTSVGSNSPMLIELSSALQPIAVAYLAAFFLARASVRVQAATGAAILAAYALLLAFVPAPGIPAGSYEKGANLVLFVDLKVLGRAHQEGWGTVLSTLPTISTTILGLLIGGLLMSRRSQRRKMAVIALTGIGAVALGLALDPVVPVVMKLWTASYGLLSAGWACLLFLLFYGIIDVLGFRKWALPLVVIGVNALAVYMGRTLVPLTRIVGIFTADAARELGTAGPMFRALAVLVVEWLILYWMYKRKIFLRA
ncbi:MAG: DUF5009 domain-containing protein [Acidobacteriota bacterium]